MHCKIMVFVVAVLVARVNVAFCNVKDTHEHSTRRSRFISFETTNDNIRVDLDFSIPFLTIPIKKTLDTVGSSDIFSNFPSVNINAAGLALGGAVVLSSTFLLPFFLKTLAVDDVERPYARFLESSEFQSDILLRGINELVIGDQRAVSCLQQVACSAASNTATVLSRSSKTGHLLNDIAGNSLLGGLLNGTVVERAIRSGYDGQDCGELYLDCPISHESLRAIVNNIAKLGKQ